MLSGRWVLAPPMLGDLVASADPDPVVAQDVIDETGKRGGARRLAGETAMQSDGQHPRRLLALAVERVEIVAQRDEEILGLTPAQATREARYEPMFRGDKSSTNTCIFSSKIVFH